MAGKQWSLIRRFNKLTFWNKLSIILGLLGIPALILAGWSLYLVYNPPKIRLDDNQKSLIQKYGADSKEVEELMQAIQDEKNQAIDDAAQVEFIDLISNIYNALDSTSSIKINEIFLDSVSGQEYRSDLIIQKTVMGSTIKLLFFLYPYRNQLNLIDIEIFQKHLEKIGANKGIIIKKGNYSNRFYSKANEYSFDLLTFENTQDLNIDKVKIPVYAKVFTPIFDINLQYTTPDYISPNDTIQFFIDKYSKTHIVSKNEGQTNAFLIDFFINVWNARSWARNRVILDNAREYKIKTSHGWFQLNSAYADIEEDYFYRFKELPILDYNRLYSLTHGEEVFLRYSFHKDLFDNIRDNWTPISDEKFNSARDKKQIKLLMLNILKRENFQAEIGENTTVD